MQPTDWRRKLVDYIRREARPEDKFGHQPRLYALACRIGEGMEFDRDIVFAAAWMHDLGVFLGHRPADPAELAKWDHVPYTIARSRELLAEWGFPAEKIEAVASAIASHQPHNQAVEIEAILLREADILEQLGAVGVLRAAAKVGRDTRYPTFSSIVPVLRNAADALPAKLSLERARLLALDRVQELKRFLAALDAEAGDSLY